MKIFFAVYGNQNKSQEHRASVSVVDGCCCRRSRKISRQKRRIHISFLFSYRSFSPWNSFLLLASSWVNIVLIVFFEPQFVRTFLFLYAYIFTYDFHARSFILVRCLDFPFRVKTLIQNGRTRYSAENCMIVCEYVCVHERQAKESKKKKRIKKN